MSDPRETPSNGRVAHISLKGRIAADRFATGDSRAVAVPVTAILSSPDGSRERELVLGERFIALEERSGWVFGMAQRDGYVGYVRAPDLCAVTGANMTVRAIRTYAKASPDLKRTEPVVYLSFGSLLEAGPQQDGWTTVGIGGQSLWVPTAHLGFRGEAETDPVSVARKFLGTPYLWGGNSAFGIDCSGLLQAALLACGISCPGDSDQQCARLGVSLEDHDTPARGDIYFWKGHVGILSDPGTLLHATAHYMSVVEEPLDRAIARIEQGEGLPVLRRARLTPRVG